MDAPPLPPAPPSRTALYFVASPLQYLAALRVAERFEPGARQVLLWYKPGVGPLVRADEWHACAYLAWPRWEPLPGPFGRLRRLRANVAQVAALAGRCDELVLHSAVFDSEAINYFLRALPPRCGARTLHARILPDGLVSIRRYPLSLPRRAAQYARKLRRLAAPELDYWCFGGDRIGSDAPFCDRIYVLPGLPHEYPADKVALLPALVDTQPDGAAPPARALVVGQPLSGAGLMAAPDRAQVSRHIHAWLHAQGYGEIHYKAHPKDAQQELREAGYADIATDQPLERFMSRTPYAAVVGVRSSALLLARQIYGPATRVVAFGWERIAFKSPAEAAAMRRAFAAAGVEFA